jgi:SAM-dependent methyltransferase
MITLVCPICSSPLIRTETSLRCANDSFASETIDGIYDLLWEEDRTLYASFLEEYIRIREAEGRGSDNYEDYLAVPYVDVPGEQGVEWGLRAKSMEWLQNYLSEHVGSRDASGRQRSAIDLGAGNCWLTRRLAEWGYDAAAVDVNIDPRDGLGAGRHYLEHLPVRFDRVRSAFAHLPFADRSIDVIVFNGALHYALDQRRTIRESLRVLRDDGYIFILDSPLYYKRVSGEKMLGERRVHGRSGYLTFLQLKNIVGDLGATIVFHHQELTTTARLRKALVEFRIGREAAVMPRVVVRKEEGGGRREKGEGRREEGVGK